MNKNSKGFSLLEVSIVILIIGVLLNFSIKGYSLLNKVNEASIINQINQYKVSIQMFEQMNGGYPGVRDGKAFSKKDFWQDLIKFKLIDVELDSDDAKIKTGGVIKVEYDGKLYFLIENKDGTGCLTPKQAFYIDKKLDDGNPNSGDIQVIGDNVMCSDSNRYFHENDKKCCRLKINID